MRRGIRLLMAVVTTAVVALAFRASMHPQPTVEGAAVVSSEQPRHASARPAPESSRDSRRSKRSTAPRSSTSSPASPRLPSTPTGSAPATSVVVAGGVVNTPYGPVQVALSARAGRITNARALQHPGGDVQTDQINAYAVPQLDRETLAAQNAHIDTVSGATFTSDGYRQSLQSALDAAHRAGAR